ncbi:MAG: hypothetical protein WC069_00350 [Candidatus Shapirobacteria bacterium]
MALVIIFGVFFNQYSRIYFRDSKNIGASTIIAQVCGGVCALLWTPLFSIDLSMSTNYWLLLIIACVFYALNDRLGADVKKNLDVSVFSILNRTSDVFLIVISVIIFKQVPGFWKIVSAIITIIGQIALTYNKKGKFQINKYFIFALLTNLVFAIALSIDIGISEQINLPFYVALTLLIPSIIIGISEKISLNDLKLEYKNSHKPSFYITGFSWGTYIVAILYAYQIGSIISVIIVNALAVIINVLIGIFVQKENKNITNKIVAMILVSIGILITIFKN